MWTSTLDLDPKRVLVTQLLRRIWRGACFSSFAPLQVQNLPRQALPTTSWVRVRNRLAGICGSDLHMIQADGDLRIAPAAIQQQRRSYPGHEVVGEVLEVGADVQFLNVGDRVALQYGPNCLSTGMQPPCRSCSLGHFNLCERGNLPPPHMLGGGWSEEMLLSEQQLFRVPPDMNDEQAVLLEPASVAVHAVLRHLPRSGERVLIIGSGTIGLLTLQAVRALAPQAEVSVLARHPFQIEQATRLGAAHIIYPQDSYMSIQRATGAQLYQGSFGNRVLLGGYDVIYDSVGSQKTLHHALRWARTQATVVLVGLNLHMMHVDLTPVWYQEVNLLGSLSSGLETWPPTSTEQRATFEITAELIKNGLLQPEHLITHRFPLNNYQAAIKTATDKAQSRAIKVVFDYSLLPASVVPNIRASAARKRRATPPPTILPTPDEQTPEEASFPIEALALSTQIEPQISPTAPTVAPPASPAHTPVVALSDEEELDMMEDTLKSPALTRRTENPATDAHEAVEETYADIPVVEAIPTTFIAAEEPPTASAQMDEESPAAIAQVDEEPAVATAQTTEEAPVTTAQTIEEAPTTPVDEPIADNPVAARIEEKQPASALLETQPVEDILYVPDENEQTIDAVSDFSESPASDTQDEWPDFPDEPSQMQDEPSDFPDEPAETYEEPPDFVEKEEGREIDESPATAESNHALLHVEKPANVQVQARPRTRKKNSRTTQRGKK
jgi:2-desacetyl-2-hydroxyethyl bacteriochlorophyllide A dehydrogenase